MTNNDLQNTTQKTKDRATTLLTQLCVRIDILLACENTYMTVSFH
jgi:hypothetical protein